jgi:uncharacterized membrane protein
VPRWVPVAGLVLSVVGLAVSTYLTITHYTDPKVLACPESSTINCAKVTTSPESVILGIPVAVLGLPFFVIMTAVNLPQAWRSSVDWLHWIRLGSNLVGIVFVLYLVYVELFKVDAICLWCTSVHVLTFLLLIVTLSGYSARERAAAT